jgi:hypothetical protein
VTNLKPNWLLLAFVVIAIPLVLGACGMAASPSTGALATPTHDRASSVTPQPHPTSTVTASRTPTLPSTPGDNCTFPATYWARQPELLISQIVVGSQVYDRNDILAILKAESAAQTDELFKQLIAAFFNFLHGANQQEISAPFRRAYAWLATHPADSQVPSPEQQTLADLIATLDDYNAGRIGPGPCLEATFTATFTQVPTGLPLASQMPTLTTSPTLTLTSTPQPSLTPTSTRPAPPSPKPTKEPPTERPPTPTERPPTPTEQPPTPTERPPTPTERPPTPTERPPTPTEQPPTPTEPPEPSPTATSPPS